MVRSKLDLISVERSETDFMFTITSEERKRTGSTNSMVNHHKKKVVDA